MEEHATERCDGTRVSFQATCQEAIQCTSMATALPCCARILFLPGCPAQFSTLDTPGGEPSHSSIESAEGFREPGGIVL